MRKFLKRCAQSSLPLQHYVARSQPYVQETVKAQEKEPAYIRSIGLHMSLALLRMHHSARHVGRQILIGSRKTCCHMDTTWLQQTDGWVALHRLRKMDTF